MFSSFARANRRDFLAMVGGAAALHTTGSFLRSQDSKLVPIEEQPAVRLLAGLEQGEWTSQDLVQAYLARIELIDKKGPRLNSVIELNPDALSLAQQSDRDRKAKKELGPLHGLPILIKDNIDTADRMATTAGSLALLGSQPTQDAFLVGQLRKAGAILLGKTNLSEWANARGNNSTSGWSARGGLTRNPYALNRNPSGSSSGSAVAVAASLCAAAIGTETDGSILSPSSANGIVGLKPTLGLISRSGVIPIAHSQDTAGPMARSVKDAALILGALVGVDPRDPATRESQGKFHTDYLRFLTGDSLEGARLGVARNFLGFHPGVDALMESALKLLRARGAILVETSALPKAEKFGDEEIKVLQYEMKAGLNAYLAGLGPKAPVRTVEDIIAFNKKNAARELPFFGQEFLEEIVKKGPLTTPEYHKALSECRRITRAEGIDKVMDDSSLDAIIGPCGGPACVTDLLLGDRGLGGDIISLAAVAGYPSITVPLGYLTGMPVGLAFTGRAWSEPKLLSLAHDFEMASKVRKAPQYRNATEVDPVGTP